MAKKVICDICGKECGRWYNVTASPDSMYDWQNVSDMIPWGETSWRYQVCNECFNTLVVEIGEMKKK